MVKPCVRHMNEGEARRVIIPNTHTLPDFGFILTLNGQQDCR